jgi:hypothetical protein
VPGEQVYRLKPLAEAPAVELLREHAPSLDASYAELAVAVRELGRLPGAIVRAAEHETNGTSWARLLAEKLRSIRRG